MDLQDIDVAGEEVYGTLGTRDVDVATDALGSIDRSELTDEPRVASDDADLGTCDHPLTESSFGGLGTGEVLEVKGEGGHLILA